MVTQQNSTQPTSNQINAIVTPHYATTRTTDHMPHTTPPHQIKSERITPHNNSPYITPVHLTVHNIHSPERTPCHIKPHHITSNRATTQDITPPHLRTSHLTSRHKGPRESGTDHASLDPSAPSFTPLSPNLLITRSLVPQVALSFRSLLSHLVLCLAAALFIEAVLRAGAGRSDPAIATETQEGVASRDQVASLRNDARKTEVLRPHGVRRASNHEPSRAPTRDSQRIMPPPRATPATTPDVRMNGRLAPSLRRRGLPP